MADLNKWMAIGRLASDPEIINTQGGKKIFKARFATLGKRTKNNQTGEWEKVTTFVDLTVFNRQNGQQLADFCEQYLVKGAEVYIEGRLILDQWTDNQSGQKRSKHLIEVDQVQLLGARPDGSNRGDSAGEPAPSSAAGRPPDEDKDVPF